MELCCIDFNLNIVPDDVAKATRLRIRDLIQTNLEVPLVYFLRKLYLVHNKPRHYILHM